MVTPTDRPTDQPTDRVTGQRLSNLPFRNLDNRKKAEICNNITKRTHNIKVIQEANAFFYQNGIVFLILQMPIWTTISHLVTWYNY